MSIATILVRLSRLFRGMPCAYGCGYRTHEVDRLLAHYWLDHAGDTL